MKWVCLLALAALLLSLGSIPGPPGDEIAHNVVGDEFMSPGPLNSAHANAARACVDCHGAARHGRFGWIRAALQRIPATGENQRCLVCHSLGEHAELAHSLDAPALAVSHLRAVDPNAEPGESEAVQIPGLANVSPDPGNRIACVLCHQDHKGAGHSLTDIADEACQVCHTRPFHSFEDGHPAFSSNYPKRLRSAQTIRFDHRHEEHRTVACLACHTLDSAQTGMLPQDFYAQGSECAACHDDGRALGKETRLFNLADLEYNAEDPDDLWGQYETLEEFDPEAEGTRLVYHADGLVRRWLEVLLRPEDEDQCKIAADILGNFVHPPGSDINDEDNTTVGACLRCHLTRAEQLPRSDNCPEDNVVRWRVERPATGRQEFTRFAHGPHLVYAFQSGADAEGCTRCHALTTEAGADFDFAAIERDTCLACHSKPAGNAGCLVCHNYHVTRVALREKQ